jgi:hypothetical protein
MNLPIDTLHGPTTDPHRVRAAANLVTSLLDVALSDVQVVSRELSLSPAMLERMRRAGDCLRCLSEVLEAGANSEAEADSRFCDQMRGEALLQVVGLVRGYLETWPDGLLAMRVNQGDVAHSRRYQPLSFR